MSDVTRREVLRIASVGVIGLVASTACDGNGEPNEPEEKKQPKEEEPPEEEEQRTAAVKRAEWIVQRSLICGSSPLSEVWAGPGRSVVHLVLSADRDCRAILYFVDAREQAEEVGIEVENGRTLEATVTVPEGKILAFHCRGGALRACRLTITAVDPPLPENVSKGEPQVVSVADPVRNPTEAPPLGTPIQIDCGKDVVLWSGRPSYVTVTLRGSFRCTARVESEGTDASSVASDGYVPFTRTFRPVTQLKGYCDGRDEDHCEFMVGETIELP